MRCPAGFKGTGASFSAPALGRWSSDGTTRCVNILAIHDSVSGRKLTPSAMVLSKMPFTSL